MTRRSGAAKALVEQSGRACRGHRLRRAPGVIPVFPNAQQEVRPSASSCQHPDGSVFQIAQLYTVTDLRGITCPWVQWHNTQQVHVSNRPRRAAEAGHCAGRRDGPARIATHDQVHELGCLAGPTVGTGVLRCAYRCRAVVALAFHGGLWLGAWPRVAVPPPGGGCAMPLAGPVLRTG